MIRTRRTKPWRRPSARDPLTAREVGRLSLDSVLAGVWQTDRVIAADDEAGGRILAAGPANELVRWVRLAPDGGALYICVQQERDGKTGAVLRRLDPNSLRIMAERNFLSAPHLHFFAVP